jgi:hypothetical protein
MRSAIRIFVLSCVLFAAVSASGYFFWYKPKFNSRPGDNVFSFGPNRHHNDLKAIERIKQKALLAKDFITEHGYNPQYCFLVDMKQPSGKKRFFVYNLLKDSIEIAGLVTHGSGSDNGTGKLVFSNGKNSNCTSLGKYKAGKPYRGNFGLAYKLYGLDDTNSNAFERFVVLHSHTCVPDEEVSPLPICVSLGCPTVSPAFLNKLKEYLDGSGQPILLWIYY